MLTMNAITRWCQNLCTGHAGLLGAALAAGAVCIVALPASAGDHRDRDGKVRVGVDLNLGSGHGPRYEERRTKVWVEPVYRTVADKVWVEPTYRTLSDRVWRDPEFKVSVERVWVPDRYEWRTYYRTDWRGVRVRVREKFLAERGHHERRESKLVIKPGCWETVERREVECEGHFDTAERRELVTPGHFEWRTERVAVERGRRDTVVGFGLDWDID